MAVRCSDFYLPLVICHLTKILDSLRRIFSTVSMLGDEYTTEQQSRNQKQNCTRLRSFECGLNSSLTFGCLKKAQKLNGTRICADTRGFKSAWSAFIRVP